MKSILSIKKMTCLKGPRFAEITILENISFSVKKGEIITILGPSGSGKSTLLRTLIGLDPIFSGQILFHGKSIQEWDIQDLRRRMGYVHQLPYLFPGTAANNILYGPKCHQTLDEDESSFVEKMLSHVGLPQNLSQRYSFELSVGQQMRVSLARTLANSPNVLLLDEPTASLDPDSAHHILQLILQLNREDGLTVLVVTHDRNAAEQLNGRWLYLIDGLLSECKSEDELSMIKLEDKKHHEQ